MAAAVALILMSAQDCGSACLYGAHDLRLEEFELSPVGDDGVRCKVISDSLCMSSFKALEQGAAHKRVPNDVATP